MTASYDKPDTEGATGAFAVRRPRVTDAIGRSLRCAYRDDARLPSDIDDLLRQLDAVPIH